MKKKALVWQFFDAIVLNDGVTPGVMCKLCSKHYKHHGNTTNLRSHISRVHPIQWELATDGVLDDESIRKSMVEDTDGDESTSLLIKRFHNSVEGEEDEHQDDQNIEAVHLVDNPSDEEWLEEENRPKYNKNKRAKKANSKIKREVVSPLPNFPSYPNYEDRQIIVASDSTPKDEYAIFGEYIANKLRKFKSLRTRGNLQQLITTIMWQAEYGIYDNTDAVKRLMVNSLHEVGPQEQTEAGEQQNEEMIT